MNHARRPEPASLAELRKLAEDEAARVPPPRERPTDELAHELQVSQIELELQNEALRQAQLALEATRDRYIDLYDFAPVGYFTLGVDGRIVEANLTGAGLLGVARAQLIGSPFARYVAPADGARWHRHARSLLRDPGQGRIELALLGAQGHCFDAQIDGLGAAMPVVGPVVRITVSDISERKHVEAELRLAATAFESQEGMMITDAKGVIERVNAAFTEITGYSADEAVGNTARLLRSGRHDAAFYAALWRSLLDTGNWQGEVWNRRKNVEVYAEWLTISAVRGDDPSEMRYVGSMFDISQRKAREEEIARLAFYDPLTGLPNRRLMKDRLHQALAVSTRAQREGALMFIDLDHFKSVNDSFGHDQGDLLLQQVAQRLVASVRECDTVARPAGDEFVVMLAPDLNDAPEHAGAQARAVGHKILLALQQPYELAGRELRCSASIGVVLFRNHDASVDELLKRADQAMYQAKATGRNTLRFYDAAIQQALQSRAVLEAELQQALRRGEFVLHYQGVVDRAGRLVGAEALVRWQHPQRGLLLPDEFIAVAEERGGIQELGRWVLGRACEQLAAWRSDPARAALSLSVNVSARQWRDAGFVEHVIATLERSGADPRRLALELTEGLMIDDVEATIARMSTLRAFGIGFALDDFGTGYASLAFLKRLPLTQLKVDRAFVRDVDRGGHDAAIARTIIALGHSLGLTVVAEGVETEAQRACLAAQDCDRFQGDLVGRPGPAEGLIGL